MNTTVISENTLSETENKQFLRLFNKALIFQSQMQYEQAVIYYEKAAVINPGHLPTHQVSGFLYQSLGRWHEALNHYNTAIDLHPYSATLQNSAGLCEERCHNLNAAKNHYLKAVELKENNAEALNNLGNICRKQGEHQCAEDYLLRALKINISVETLANLGLLMSELRNFPQSNSFYEHAIRLQPNNPQLNWNKSLNLLSEGNLDYGWRLYDQGILAKTRVKQYSPQVDNSSDYTVEYFKNKSVYIKREQGVGDEIMFASCFPEIIRVSKKCIIECDDRLIPLFQRSFPQATILSEYDAMIDRNNAAEISDVIKISSGSLPRFLRRSFRSFPTKNSYLTAHGEAVKNWTHRYSQKQKNINIGVSWIGGINEESRRRSTQLIDWIDLFGTENTNFINLQYGDLSGDKDLIDTYLTEWSDTNHYHNLEQLAAQISALDLVITVSNVTAHLAGALGIPVFIMLPHSPNWRWFMGKNPSPWYSSATLFPQKKVDDWSDVFVDVENALYQFIMNRENEKNTVIPLASHS